MLLMQDDVADVDRRRVSVTELLLQFEESRLDLVLDVFFQLALVTNQFGLGGDALIIIGLRATLGADRWLVLLWLEIPWRALIGAEFFHRWPIPR